MIVLVIPDTQLPFAHKDAVPFLEEVARRVIPNRIVHIGDFWDQYSLSDYAKDPDALSPGDEAALALEHSQAYYELFPKVELVLGNHDMRIFKNAMKGVPRVLRPEYHQFMDLPKGWKAHADGIMLDGVRYFHGEGYSGVGASRNAAIDAGCPVVHGHLHSRANISYVDTLGTNLWGMNVGSLIDQKAYAFAYAKHARYKSWLGCGVVKNGVPFLVPMGINARGRWNKKVQV